MFFLTLNMTDAGRRSIGKPVTRVLPIRWGLGGTRFFTDLRHRHKRRAHAMNVKTLSVSSLVVSIIVLFILGSAPIRAGAQSGDDPPPPQARSGPELKFEHLTLEDGLSHNEVQTIVQDHQGLMWFGTFGGGLNRFDGYEFRVYQHNPLLLSHKLP